MKHNNNPFKMLDRVGIYKIALAIFIIIVLPVWLIRGCNAAQEKSILEPEPDLKTTEPEIVFNKPSIPVTVYDHKKGIIIEMDLDEYLVGVIAAEMPASFEPEALKAQAVAARTYTVKKMRNYGGSGCSGEADICTDSNHCQAYRDEATRVESWGASAQAHEIKIRSAVNETFGLIVTYEGQPIQAFFHSTSGGMTEDSQNAFSEALPYLHSVPSDEVSAPRYQNKLEVSRKEFVNTVNDAYPKAKLKRSSLEKNIEIIERFESGRISRLKLGQTEISGKELRKLFSLDSSNVTFEYAEDFVIMHTKGYGHGVGMSQNGANDMAKNGADFQEILTYYYQGTSIDRLY